MTVAIRSSMTWALMTILPRPKNLMPLGAITFLLLPIPSVSWRKWPMGPMGMPILSVRHLSSLSA